MLTYSSIPSSAEPSAKREAPRTVVTAFLPLGAFRRRCRREGRLRSDPYSPSGCISQWKVELAIVNGENAADQGFGITQSIYEELLSAGADAITLGNHSWNRREALQFIKDAPRLIRPINYLSGTPGRGSALIETKSGGRALVINALGRLFMEPVEDPFGRIGAELDAHPLGHAAGAIVVDFHCEATGEKRAAGHFCDGRASLVVGTHTHTPSADDRILSGGTAFMTDVGMTGDFGVLHNLRPYVPCGLPLQRDRVCGGQISSVR